MSGKCNFVSATETNVHTHESIPFRTAVSYGAAANVSTVKQFKTAPRPFHFGCINHTGIYVCFHLYCNNVRMHHANVECISSANLRRMCVCVRVKWKAIVCSGRKRCAMASSVFSHNELDLFRFVGGRDKII